MRRNVAKRSFSLAFVAVLCVTMVFATTGSKTLTASYNNIKITIDGEAITPKNSGGQVVEPFTVDGTTYLPVRAIANALGKDVDWDAVTNTVIITTPDLTVSPSPSPSPTSTPFPSPSPSPTIDASQVTVYVSSASNTIHSVNDCGGMKYYTTMKLDKARKITSKYCTNCGNGLIDIE